MAARAAAYAREDIQRPAATVNRPAQQTQVFQPPRQQQQQVPAWLQGGGGNKNEDTLNNALPPGSKNQNNQIANRPNRKPEDELGNQDNMPAWADTLQTAWNVASPLLSGPAGIPTMASRIASLITPSIVDALPNQKTNDQLTTGNPKTIDRLGRMSGRTMFGAGVGPGTLDPSLWNTPRQGGGQGGFGSRYGGNWGGGGYGGGGYGGGGWDYASKEDYPAWVKTLMGLNSWNIK